ncbi:MAG TPA: protein kinase [Vicinamibacterales bacterium]|nr:protein kinase [Vicinamibacterales bacterium]
MALAPGTRLGPYEVVSLLGTGGMGEVYRARDTTLGRDVALKTLPDRVTHDPERLARFRREAQVLAALNHPHIGTIYGLEESSGHRVLVLELVEGETLAQRIERGPLPVDDAVAIAREMAEALAAAHEKGIVHRDLKPANIALTADDRVKVLDFGLAKATDGTAAHAGAGPLDSPTVTSPAGLTGMGVILGTAAYMSPEQARGRVADKRSDVWAFGCVLFEMLAGRRAFGNDDVSDTFAAVLKGQPDWTALPASLPPAVRSLVEGCLEKNPRDRVGDISTALFVLRRSAWTSDVPSPRRAPARARAVSALLVLGGAAVGAMAGIALWPRPAPPAPVARFALRVPGGLPFTLSRRMIAVSRDGTSIAYVAAGRIFIRTLSDAESRAVAGADPGIQPAFSPAGDAIVFWDDRALKRVAANGSVPVTVCEVAPAPLGLDWTDQGILFVDPGGGIKRVSPNGGTPTTLVPPADGAIQGVQLLPDGDTLLFTVARGGALGQLRVGDAELWDKAEIVVQSIRTGERRTLLEGGSDARYLPSGHLTYMAEGTMLAVPFDVGARAVTGAAVPVVEGIQRAAVSAAAQFAVSDTGTLVYLPGPARGGQGDLFLYELGGKALPLNLPRGSYAYPRASPDGTWLAFETFDGKQTAVSLYELSGASSARRLTFGGNNRLPIWSRNGQRVAFQSDREGDRGIFWQPVSGGPAERLTRAGPGESHVPEAWSPTGDVFLFSSTTSKGVSSLWTYSVSTRQAERFRDVTSTGVPTNAVFSPDGKLIAYQVGTASLGEAITYVEPFPPTGDVLQIARGGRPLWSPSRKATPHLQELLFVPGPSQLMSVSVRTDPALGNTPAGAVPRQFGLAPPASPRPYDILPDGRFVAVDSAAMPGGTGTRDLQVVLNWFEELKSKVPAAR